MAAILSSGEGQLDPAAVRSGLVTGMQTAQAAARSEVRAEQDLQLASHAVVAWIDELMLGYPDWGTTVPNLQGELLGTQIARETFFNYLEQLDDSQDEVREVYYMLLCLGFRGYYGELSNGREELERLKDLHGRRLQMVPASAAVLNEERLSPQPYGVKAPPPLPPPRPKPRPRPKPQPRPEPAPMPEPQPRPRPPAPAMPRVQPTPPRAPLPRRELRAPKKRRLGLILGLCLVPIILLAVAGFFLLPGWLRQQVDQQVVALECAHLETSLGADRVVTLEGYVSSEGDRQNLLSRLGQVFGLAGVKDNIAVYPWPFCEVLDIVGPYFDRNIARGLNLTLGVTAEGNALKDGDPLVLTLRTPDYPAYLYVDYYQQNGDVAHVAHAKPDGTPDSANDEFEYPTGYQGSEPYGLELLTVFSSPVPIFAAQLPTFENAATYFPALRQRLQELAASPDGDSIAASVVFIRTEPGAQ